MEVTLVSQGSNEAPKLTNLQRPIIDQTNIPKMIFCVVESGMASGEPSVIIAVESPSGTVCIQTSLDKLITATSGMITMAETNFNWTRPEGSATLMPMSKESRKVLLEALKKELEEWDEVDVDDL
jgi:hypothetical protein